MTVRNSSDPRTQADIARSLSDKQPGYTPGFVPTSGSKGDAMQQLFARCVALLDKGARGVPQRHLRAFLDMLGIRLLPAQAARVPIVFKLTTDCPVDVTLAADSQLAAQPNPAPVEIEATATSDQQPALFFTEKTVTLARAKLAALYSVDPNSDEFADHTSRMTSGFEAFGDMERMEHAIYLGHDRLFKLGGNDITLLLHCALGATPQQPLEVEWQYLSAAGWISLQKTEEDDTTRGFTRDGQIGLRLASGPDAKRETFNGRSSYWVRGTLKSRVTRGEDLRNNPLTIDDLRIRVRFKKKGLLPEAAFNDGAALDVSKDFYPFGRQAATYSTFYIASAEVFQRAGALAYLDIALSEAGVPATVLALRWEYLSSSGWQALGITVEGTGAADYNFDLPARELHRVSFLCPRDWVEAKVNGASNFWLRIRIEQGNFGTAVNTVLEKDQAGNVIGTKLIGGDLAAPVVSKFALSYTYLTDTEALDHCLARNEFVFDDQTEAARWPDRSFDPFCPVEDLQPTLHFDFDKKLPVGLISIFVAVPGAEEDAPNTSSSFAWEYLARDGWKQLGVRDETNGLRQSGMVQFIGPADAVPARGLSGDSYRVRARSKSGTESERRPVIGAWLNSVWARHCVRSEQELLGNADGTAGQALRFARTPVLEDETVEVREWSGRGEGWQLLEREIPTGELRFDREPVTQKITSVWVRWRERSHLYEATASDRVFVLDRATGLLRFGNGTQGMIPPAGSPIIGSYSSGGGSMGNVPRDSVSQLRSAVPFVSGATNPIAAEGGADSEAQSSIARRGPQQIRHRHRAISVADIEWIASDASPHVARARCLDITGPVGHGQRGWITVIVIPRSNTARPLPSPELQRRVAGYLRARVPATVAKHLRVVEPTYVAVSVVTEIVPLSPDDAARVEQRLRQALDRFLHPLTGGPRQCGWRFGEGLQLSNIAAVIEATDGVDFARDIHLFVGDADQGDTVIVPRDALLCAGKHELKLTLEID